MSAYHKNDTVKRDIMLPKKVEIGLLDAGATAKEGLLAQGFAGSVSRCSRR